MTFFNFGYAERAIKSAAQIVQSRNTGPIQSPFPSNQIMTGDFVKSQISYVKVLGGKFDYLWGSHLWGSSKYKVTA